jgi:GMP reductase
MRIITDIKYDFQDVLLVPKRSSLSSRSEVDLNRLYKFKYSSQSINAFGVIVANMDSIGTFSMAKIMAEHNMLTSLHKHYSVDQLVDFFSTNLDVTNKVFYSIGMSVDDEEKLDKFVKNIGKPPQNISIDVANGYSEKFISYVKKIRDQYKDSVIMAGNCVTPELGEQLILAGADIVKCGIGSGAMCTTRIVTGTGFPQFSAVVETADAVHGLGGHLCSDGGCITSGDVAKAFGAGADFVMLGTMLSGHEECEGNLIEKDGKQYKQFYGMSSKSAMDKHNGGVAEYRASEGRTVLIPYKGPVRQTIQQIIGGVRSACTYSGAKKIKELPKRATFIIINRTHNTSYESATVGF